MRYGHIAQGTAAARAPAGSGNWTIVKEFHGETGTVETARFATSSRTFRISWKTR